ncbi:hypothetical protein LCGC14_2133150, partial [marine sediment metagenome]
MGVLEAAEFGTVLAGFPLYAQIRDILGPTGTIIPIGDIAQENSARTTVTTLGSQEVVFTYSEAVSSFATPPTITGPGRLPLVAFNGTDEEADTPDAAFWSRNDAGGANGFSLGLWANVTSTGAARCFMAKYDEASSLREWIFFHNSDHTLRLFLFDESVDGTGAYRSSNATITMDALCFFVATYDGTGGGTAANGITLYENGGAIASTTTNQGTYEGMENLAGVVSLGRN